MNYRSYTQEDGASKQDSLSKGLNLLEENSNSYYEGLEDLHYKDFSPKPIRKKSRIQPTYTDEYDVDRLEYQDAEVGESPAPNSSFNKSGPNDWSDSDGLSRGRFGDRNRFQVDQSSRNPKDNLEYNRKNRNKEHMDEWTNQMSGNSSNHMEKDTSLNQNRKASGLTKNYEDNKFKSIYEERHNSNSQSRERQVRERRTDRSEVDDNIYDDRRQKREIKGTTNRGNLDAPGAYVAKRKMNSGLMEDDANLYELSNRSKGEVDTLRLSGHFDSKKNNSKQGNSLGFVMGSTGLISPIQNQLHNSDLFLTEDNTRQNEEGRLISRNSNPISSVRKRSKMNIQLDTELMDDGLSQDHNLYSSLFKAGNKRTDQDQFKTMKDHFSNRETPGVSSTQNSNSKKIVFITDSQKLKSSLEFN